MAAGNTSFPNEVQLLALIGEGAYGEVFRAEWMGKKVAAKRIKKTYFDNDYDHRRKEFFVKKFKDECQLLEEIKHPNIVEFYRVIAPPGESPLIVMELLDKDLASLICQSRSEPRVSFPDTVRIMHDVAKGLRYLHQKSIVHRDLSSRNILLTREKQAKIADLGVAKRFESYFTLATAVPGAVMYAAPEVYSHTRYRRKAVYTPKVDIFSYGVVLLEVITGHLPSYLVEPYNEDGEVVEEYIRRSEDLYKMGPFHPLRNLVESCLKNNPEDRPEATEIVEELKHHRKDIGGSTTSLPPVPEDVILLTQAHQFDYRFKVVVLGEVGVGKSTIIRRLIKPNEQFEKLPRLDRQPFTFEEYFEQLQVRGKWVHLHIVDSNGQERFHNIRDVVPQIYRYVKGAIVVFDLSCQVTLTEVDKWVNLVRSKRGVRTPIILVGNKSDLPNLPAVNAENAQKYAEENNLFYIETSCKSRINIDETFSILVEMLIKDQREQVIAEDFEEDFEDNSTIQNLIKVPEPSKIDKRRPTSPLPSNEGHAYVRSTETTGEYEVNAQSLRLVVPSKPDTTHNQTENRKFWNKCCKII